MEGSFQFMSLFTSQMHLVLRDDIKICLGRFAAEVPATMFGACEEQCVCDHPIPSAGKCNKPQTKATRQ